MALPVWDALAAARARRPDRCWPRRRPPGRSRFRLPEGRRPAARGPRPARRSAPASSGSTRRRGERERLVKRHGDPEQQPWIYLIVATGDIYEDIPQAQAAAREGADIIAVIRSTGQSLLDYVPEGADPGGLRRHLRDAGELPADAGRAGRVDEELGRYVRLTNYASGLCMPEIATLAGLERLDMMLNDSMYGILFRDINPVRTFVDQRFSPAGPRPRRDHHQHRRGQLPDHRRRGRGGAHGDGVASCSTSSSRTRRGWRTGSSGSGTRSRSTRTCPSRSGWSWRTRCWPGSCSRTRR